MTRKVKHITQTVRLGNGTEITVKHRRLRTTPAKHVRRTVIEPLSDEQRRNNYVRQNGFRAPTTAQKRQMRKTQKRALSRVERVPMPVSSRA